MIRFKDGVRTSLGVHEKIFSALAIADSFAVNGHLKDGSEGIVVTSLMDGTHSPASLHYKGRAADIRIWNLEDPKEFVIQFALLLGFSEYDVILEGNHIHVEFQPK